MQMTFGRLCVGVCANVRTFLQRIALRWKIKQKRNVRGLIKVRSTKSVKNCFCFFFFMKVFAHFARANLYLSIRSCWWLVHPSLEIRKK